MKQKTKYRILLILFIASLISSFILSVNLLKPSDLICSPGEGCSIVANSPYSKTLGIENEYIGFFFFLAMTFLTISHLRNPTEKKKRYIFIGVFIGALWAVYSIYLMEFVINAFCKYCTVIDISSLLALALDLIFRE